MTVIGVIPMAGTGSRLGLPFHKALAPTILPNGTIVPMYRHAFDRLAHVADETYFVLALEQRLDPCLRDLPGYLSYKARRGELPSSIAVIAGRHPEAMLALALPDSIWWPENALVRVRERVGAHDGALGLFYGSNHILDEVVTDADGKVREVVRHSDPPAPSENVWGWGCFIIRAECLTDLTDSLPLAPQLEALDLVGVRLPGPYHDLGTPARYAKYMTVQEAD